MMRLYVVVFLIGKINLYIYMIVRQNVVRIEI